MRRRRLLVSVSAFWLVCQVAAAALSPFARCCDNGHHRASHGPEQCHGTGPGRLCPIHRPDGERQTGHSGHAAAAAHHHGASHDRPGGAARPVPADDEVPSLRCRCRISTDALAAMLLGPAILPPDAVFPIEPASLQPDAPGTVARARAALPDTPPPRA